MDNKQILIFQKTAEQICRQAGKILLQYRGDVQILRSKKDFGDIVTSADIASEKYIIENLKKAFPTHSFLSEESGASSVVSDFRWIIDPLDGTKEFARGVPLFAINLALEYKHSPIVAIVCHPVLGDMYSAALGLGAKLNDDLIHVSQVDTLEKSIVYIHSPKNTEEAEKFDYLWNKIGSIAKKLYRTFTGSSEQFYCPWIARGSYEGYWLPVSYPSWWDVAPLILLIAEAGGTVTTSGGKTVTEQNFATEGILATNGHIHEQLLLYTLKGSLKS